MVSHVSPSSWTGSNGSDNSPILLLVRHYRIPTEDVFYKIVQQKLDFWGLYDIYICVFLNSLRIFIPRAEIILFINHYF